MHLFATGAACIGDDESVALICLGLSGVQVGGSAHGQAKDVGHGHLSAAGNCQRELCARARLVDHQAGPWVTPPVPFQVIANGMPLFRLPRVARTKRTEVLLGVILAGILLGLAILARDPDEARRLGIDDHAIARTGSRGAPCLGRLPGSWWPVPPGRPRRA